eukprot:COSAG02_NODE_3331_length_6920_cov_2.706641_3_plen_406_part_00
MIRNDAADNPEQFTQAEWEALRNALYKSDNQTEREMGKLMNVMQHYYRELGTFVLTEGRKLAEAACLRLLSLRGNLRTHKMDLNAAIRRVQLELQEPLRTLQTNGNTSGAHFTDRDFSLRKTTVEAAYQVALAVRHHGAAEAAKAKVAAEKMAKAKAAEAKAQAEKAQAEQEAKEKAEAAAAKAKAEKAQAEQEAKEKAKAAAAKAKAEKAKAEQEAKEQAKREAHLEAERARIEREGPWHCNRCHTHKEIDAFDEDQRRKYPHTRKCKQCCMKARQLRERKKAARTAEAERIERVGPWHCSECGNDKPLHQFGESQKKHNPKQRKCESCLESCLEKHRELLRWVKSGGPAEQLQAHESYIRATSCRRCGRRDSDLLHSKCRLCFPERPKYSTAFVRSDGSSVFS